jgi:hypothetical protein
MVKKSMVDELIVDGAKLLEELDHENFPVEAMFWIDEPDEARSRLVIASSEVVEQGSTPGYRRIREMLPGLNLAGLEVEDIYLAEPDSRRFKSMLSLAENSPKIIPGRAWIRKADAVVYRWSPAALKGRLEPPLSREQIEQVWEAAGSSFFGKPTLLVTVAGDAFTLRVHPKHRPGMDWDLPRVRRDFETAIRNSRPECRITWLSEDSNDVAA